VKIPLQNLYYLLAYAWNYSEAAREREASAASIQTLPDLLAHVLASRTRSLLKRGLDRQYVEQRLVVAGVRGKLDLSATIKSNQLPHSRTTCIVDGLERDVLHNRILRETLRGLLALPKLNVEIRAKLRSTYRSLDGISAFRVDRSSFRRLQLHRNNRPYRFLMNLCQLIHESLMVEEDGSFRFADVRDQHNVMASLFERFVTNFFREEQSVFGVSGQSPLPWYMASSTVAAHLRHLPIMRPDIVLAAKSRRIIIETKYYFQALSSDHHGLARVRADHLYQIFAYLENRDAAEEQGPPYEGLLLYPTVDRNLAFDFRVKGRRIQVRTINLHQEWWRIHDDLLELVDVVPERLAG
jgi:5-methylcytosine-specific restriction enzyme subunit McrC